MATKAQGIFSRIRLRPGQFRTVANRRLADAEFLRGSVRNQHANGTMYLAGFVIECLLKAKLMEQHPWLQTSVRPEASWSREQSHLWFLCHRSHDLEGILGHLVSVQARLAAVGLDRQLREICGEWTIHARYSTRTATMKEATQFLCRIKEIRPWLN